MSSRIGKHARVEAVMPKQVIFIADPSVEFFGGQAVSKKMVEDMLTISSVATEAVVRLAEALEQELGIPTSERLDQIVSEFVPDKTQASAIRTALVNLWRSRVDPLLRELEEWRTADPRNTERLSDHKYAAIKERLLQLIRDYPALKRFRKARRLITLTGSRVQEIEILCDIRPVFDEDRKKIEGMIPLTTLKMAYEGQDEESKVVEVLLSPEMLDKILSEAQKAKQKLTTLQNLVSELLPSGWVEVD